MTSNADLKPSRHDKLMKKKSFDPAHLQARQIMSSKSGVGHQGKPTSSKLRDPFENTLQGRMSQGNNQPNGRGVQPHNQHSILGATLQSSKPYGKSNAKLGPQLMGSSQLQPEFYLTQTKYFDPTTTHHQATKQMSILSSQISQSQLEQVIKSMRSQNQLNQMKLKKTSDFMGTYQQYQLNQQKLDQFNPNVSMPKVLKNLEEYEKKIAQRD